MTHSFYFFHRDYYDFQIKITLDKIHAEILKERKKVAKERKKVITDN